MLLSLFSCLQNGKEGSHRAFYVLRLHSISFRFLLSVASRCYFRFYTGMALCAARVTVKRILIVSKQESCREKYFSSAIIK